MQEVFIIERESLDHDNDWSPAGECYPLTSLLTSEPQARRMLDEYKRRWPDSNYRLTRYVLAEVLFLTPRAVEKPTCPSCHSREHVRLGEVSWLCSCGSSFIPG